MSRHVCNRIELRRVRETDINEIYRIEKSVFRNPYPPYYLSLLAALTPHFLVAQCEGRVVAYAVAVVIEGRVCHVLSIAVERGMQGMGIGKKLLQRLLLDCCSVGAKTAMLEVEYTNYAAQRLYLSLGFRYAATLPNYYGEGRHGLVMIALEPCAARRGHGERDTRQAL